MIETLSDLIAYLKEQHQKWSKDCTFEYKIQCENQIRWLEYTNANKNIVSLCLVFTKPAEGLIAVRCKFADTERQEFDVVTRPAVVKEFIQHLENALNV